MNLINKRARTSINARAHIHYYFLKYHPNTSELITSNPSQVYTFQSIKAVNSRRRVEKVVNARACNSLNNGINVLKKYVCTQRITKTG
jgi:hypothetical protein